MLREVEMGAPVLMSDYTEYGGGDDEPDTWEPARCPECAHTNLRLYLEFLALETLKSSERQINQLWSSVAEKRKGFKNMLKGFVGVRRGGEVEWQTLCLAAGLRQLLKQRHLQRHV